MGPRPGGDERPSAPCECRRAFFCLPIRAACRYARQELFPIPEERNRSCRKGAAMKLINPWKLLFRPATRRLRRRPHDFHFVESLAAEVLEVRQLLASIAPQVTLTTAAAAGGGQNVTLTSTDINNPNVTITRSGNLVIFTGTNGTQITYTNNGSTG